MHSDFSYIIERYKVPAALDRAVIIDGDAGTIVGAEAGYIMVKFEKSRAFPLPCHPTWRAIYLGEGGEILWEPASETQRATVKP